MVELRRRLMLQAQIARSVGVSESTVSRVLAGVNLSKPSDLWPTELMQRYEHDAPAMCCMSTPRSPGASCGSVTASRATDATG